MTEQRVLVQEPIDRAGRMAFLCCLQNQVPEFWRAYHDVWLMCRKSEDLAPEIFEEKLTEAFNLSGVVDQWFQEVIRSTLALWSRDPNGPNAQLNPDYIWLDYPELEDPPPFIPVIRPPVPRSIPLGNGEEELIATMQPTHLRPRTQPKDWVDEELDEFEERARTQFEKQLRI